MPGERGWQPRDVVQAGIFTVAGIIVAILLPAWLWALIAAAGFVAYLGWTARRNRRRGLPPRWSPGGPPGQN